MRQPRALWLVLACMLLAGSSCAFALDPKLDVNQYAHTAWKIREGFAKGQILSIVQTPDGYLWLGTEFGLLRFDGVRNVPWKPPGDQHLPSNYVMSLLAQRDGTLWIGTDKGLASWKDGRLTHYAEFAGHFIYKLLEDREGSVWVSDVAVPTGKVCAIHNGSVQCYGEDGSLGIGVFNLYEDSKGNIWGGGRTGLWRWKNGPPKFYLVPEATNGIGGLNEDDDGALLMGLDNGIGRFVDGKTEEYRIPGRARQFRPGRMLRDRDGGLWIGSLDLGLVHVHQGRTDVFGPSDGLSGESAATLFEDREGNIWVGTIDGLDRFRDFALATFTAKQGLSKAPAGAVLADRDGSVWLTTDGGLNRWSEGRITAFGKGNKPDGKLNGHVPHSLFQDDRGRIWVSTRDGTGYLENDQFISISGIPGGLVRSIVEDTGGNLWIANQEFGLFRLLRGSEPQQIPWAGLGRKDFATALIADPLQGGLWLGFFLGGVAYFKDGKVHASYAVADGLGQGHVNGLRLDQDGTLWAATEGGLSRLKNGRIATLSSKNGLPCDTVHWVTEDEAHSLWVNMSCGLARIARSELDGWATAVERDKTAKPTIQATVFDISDGVMSRAYGTGYSPQVAKSSDGRLWFTAVDGVNVLDPNHIPFNKLPPPVHIEQIIADHKTYDLTSIANGQVHLPARVRDLQIDYTALSLVAPEKVLFRYKLEGWDSDWQDAGTRRQAFYSNLPPRNYTFRVRASNNSGVWNEAGASLGFSVAPAYYQTWWFRTSCAIAFLLLLAALYQLRLRQLARQFNMRLDERVGERTRIARDLHDTLLQSFQGVLLKFHAVTFVILDRPAEAKKTLEMVIDQARQAITEGRDAVQGLRSSTVVISDLALAITTFGEELASPQAGRNSPNFSVQVEGKPRSLAPLLGEEVYRIAGEALRNAFRHADAARIEVEIRFGRRQLRLRVRDNGKGIDPKYLDGGGRAGHFGLPGMHERAKLVGGKLAIWSQLDSGTEAELTIPASVAYSKSSAARRSRFWAKGA